MTREDGFEFNNAVGIGELDASTEGIVQVSRVSVAGAVAICDDTGVDTGGVG